MSTIAFIGLGNMGLPMARNLKGVGHELHVFDTAPEAVEKAAAGSMTAAPSAAEAARRAEFIVTMLPDGPVVLKVFEKMVQAAPAGAVVIDCSTIDIASAKMAHEMARQAGLLLLDAPVSGGTAGAAAGTLTFMVGGSEEAFDKAKPLLDVMGGKIIHCGEGGSGQAAKICNNMLLAISMIGAGEAFALAERIGLSPQAAFDVISTSSGSCWSVNTYCPVPGAGPESPADRDYTPGFATALMLKDLGLAQQAASETAQATPLGEHALQLYQRFAADGGAGLDFSGIIEFLKDAKRNDG